MKYEKAGAGIATFSRIGGDFIITVPPARTLGVLLFLPVWLVGWAFGEIMVCGQLLGYGTVTPNAAAYVFLVIWLVGWTIGGAWAIYSFVWNLFGQEIVRLNLIDLLHYKQIAGIRFASKKYRMNDAIAFKPAAAAANKVRGNGQAITYDKSSVSFDYGRKTIAIFPGIDEAEAKHIISQMKASCAAVRLG